MRYKIRNPQNGILDNSSAVFPFSLDGQIFFNNLPLRAYIDSQVEHSALDSGPANFEDLTRTIYELNPILSYNEISKHILNAFKSIHFKK